MSVFGTRSFCLVITVLLLAGATEAAPPTATYLFPAGGQRGGTTTVTVAGTFSSWPVQVASTHPGVTVTAAKEKGKLSVQVAADADPAVAWIRLHNKEGASSPRPFVIGSVPEIEEKEPNDEVSKAQAVSAPSVVINGRLGKSGDVDCYAVELKKGQRWVASLLASETLGSPMDGVLQVLDARGFILEQSNDVRGLDPEIVFEAPADGTYLVRVFAFPSKPDSSIRHMGAETYVYRLTLATAGHVEHPWPLAVPRANPGSVTLVGPGIPADAKPVAVPGVPGDEAILWQAGVTGQAIVRLEPHPCFVVEGWKEQAPPFTVSGKLLQPGQVISLPIRVTKGKPLLIQCEGNALTPILLVRDAGGKQLARTEAATPTQNVELTFTPTADGVVQLEISDVYRSAGPRHWFRVRVLPPTPDFTLTTTVDRLDLAPGKPADLTVTVTRRNGFKGDIDLIAENLPAGVKATPVKPAKPDGKTLTLRFTTDKAGDSGLIRLLGKGAGVDQPRPVLTTLTDLGTVPVGLWLKR